MSASARKAPLSPPPNRTTCEAIRDNIAMVSRMEEKYLNDRKPGERIADAVGSFSGSMSFVLLHVAFFGLWILINTHALRIVPAFDPFPFLLLSLVVSLEAIFLSTFVLMKQNRMSKRADSRAHLDLQINLLAEREMTMVLQMLRLIGERVGVEDERLDRELAQLSRETPVETLATEIEESLPKEA